ncbi:MAG TPA: preprotein translocase subunit SecG [Lachnospiraceae bacterium]|nr:preprotein translocase subunit SecG [Lachnospiraceae bacterium]
MGTLRLILTIIYLIDCVFLTVVVLMQEGKSAGLGALSGSTDTYWSRNKGRSFEGKLVLLTKIAAVMFLVLSAVLNITRF